MVEQTFQIHLFYPLLFLTVIIIGGLITFYLFKNKDDNLFDSIFHKHADEHIELHNDTTTKIKEIITWTPEKEKEIHAIETKLHEFEVMLIEINSKIDTLSTRIMFLEKQKRA